MFLIISENEQIIGADKEFIGESSFEEIKEHFPSMSIYLLHHNTSSSIEFDYKNNSYIVKKYPLVINNTEANLYEFQLNSKNNKDETNNVETTITPTLEIDTNKTNESNQQENSSTLEFKLNTDNNPLEININDTSNNEKEENKPSLDFGLDLSQDKPLEIDIDQTSADDKEEDKPSLDFGLDLSQDKPLEINVEDNTPNEKEEIKNTTKTFSLSQEEIEHDLNQVCQDLGIDRATAEEFFEEFKQQLVDEKENFDNGIASSDYELLHKTAHKLKGVALNLRLNKFGEILKTIDEAAKEEKNITEIQSMLNDLYSVIDTSNITKTPPTFEIDLSIPNTIDEDDYNIILKSFIPFLEDLQTKDEETIKKQLQYANSIFHLKALENIPENHLNEFVNALLDQVKRIVK